MHLSVSSTSPERMGKPEQYHLLKRSFITLQVRWAVNAVHALKQGALREPGGQQSCVPKTSGGGPDLGLPVTLLLLWNKAALHCENLGKGF